MMDKDTLNRTLLDPVAENLDMDELEALVEKYPAFTTGRILLLLAMQKSSDPHFHETLKKSAPFIHNRRHLYHLLHSGMAVRLAGDFTDRFNRVQDLAGEEGSGLPQAEKKIVEPGQTENAGNPENASTDLLDFSYSGTETSEGSPVRQDEEVEQVDQEYEAIVSHASEDDPRQHDEKDAGKQTPEESTGKFTNWIDRIEDKNAADDHNEGEDLIEKFINDGHSPIRADKETSISGDISRKSIEEDDSLITDTLARIYVKQGLYSKAIYAYEKLSLKYPEKSIYFATQIEEIKQLINNK